MVLTELKHEERSVVVAVHLDTEKQNIVLTTFPASINAKGELVYTPNRRRKITLKIKEKVSLGRAQTGYNCPESANSQRDF